MFSSLSLVLCASAQPVPVLGLGWDPTVTNGSGYSWSGPKILFPGYHHYYAFSNTEYSIPITCAATGNTCDVAGSGYSLTGNEVNMTIWAPNMPTGLQTLSEAFTIEFKACNVSGTTFQPGMNNSCANPAVSCTINGTPTMCGLATFTSTGSGVKLKFTPATGLVNGYVTSNTGWPSGTVLTYGYPRNCCGGWLSDAFTGSHGTPEIIAANLQGLMMDALIPSSATAGDYSITMTLCGSDDPPGMCTHLSSTLTFVVTVRALTFLSDANEPTSFPPIPGLSTWVSMMTDPTNGGGKWCDKTTGQVFLNNGTSDLTASFGNGNQINFYDGNLVYHLISNYLHDPGWELCSKNIGDQIAFETPIRFSGLAGLLLKIMASCKVGT